MGFVIPPPPMETARSLMAQKDAIQADLDVQFGILSANNSTLHTPLVDPQGFPRADIDVYAVRHARVRVIELRNDMESVMNQLAKALEGVYDPRNGGNVTEGLPNKTAFSAAEASEGHKPFARVDGVAPSSPAAQAVCLSLLCIVYKQYLRKSSRAYCGKTSSCSLEPSPRPHSSRSLFNPLQNLWRRMKM
jgi:26S proteasome regulatory subunit N4